MAVTLDISRQSYTALDLERLSAQGFRYELIRGGIFEMSPTSFRHGMITSRFSTAASSFVEDHDLGECSTAETGYLLGRNPDTVLAPDWAYISKDRLPETIPYGYLPIVPDIVLETRSPNDSPREVALKITRWLDAGVRMAIELDPASKRLSVHRAGRETAVLGPKDTFDGDDVLPGFVMPLSKIFKKSDG